MKSMISLDDLELFLAVAEAGGLTGAVGPTGQSAPTLSRKMAAIEQATGRHLFLRGPRGYALTAEGRALVETLSPLARVRESVEGWVAPDQAPRVRITAGTWTSHWLASNLSRYWSPDAGWVPEFLASNAVLDIARREADLGFRNRRPEQNWLAGRRTRTIEYAVYGASAAVEGFVTLAENLATTPMTRWVYNTHPDAIVTTVSNARLELDLARQGIARAVLPVFAASTEDGIVQLSEPIAALTHDEWLVTHHDGRHDPPVRRAIDAIVGFIEQGARQ